MNAELELKAYKFRERIEHWFLRNSRDFPWRHSQNPLHLLVAEILLRKTQAERVELVFSKFCARYKDAQDIIKENPESLYKLLGSLGLKQRVNWLIDVCHQLIRQYDGELPLEYNELLKLKGVGPYTASMVLLALKHTAPPPIDNNIARLVSRVFSIQRVGDTRREKKIRQILDVVFTKGEPSLIAFAMLDLAGMVCSARNPKNNICPINSICSYNLS